MKLSEPDREKVQKAEVLAVGEAPKALFWPIPDFKKMI